MLSLLSLAVSVTVCTLAHALAPAPPWPLPPVLGSAPPWPLPPVVGFVIGAEWYANFSSSAALRSLDALAATGASTVRVLLPAVVDDETSTSVHGVADGQLATARVEDVAVFIAHATALNLSIVLSPSVDLWWGTPSNIVRKPWYSNSPVSRHDIGADFTDAQADAFFASFQAFLLNWATFAAAHAAPGASAACELGARGGVAALTLGDGLTHVFVQETRMRALINALRGEWKGCISAITDGKLITEVLWWDQTDFISHEAYWPLGDAATPIGAPLDVTSMASAWAPAVQLLRGVSAAAGGKRVVLLTAGAQSRPNCHLAPWGTGAPSASTDIRTRDGNNQGDVSSWPCSYDEVCQARVYESLISAFSQESWWGGVTFYRWSADPTSGGPSDNDFTPHGKDAEAVFRAWTGTTAGDDATGAGDDATGARAIASALRVESARAMSAAAAPKTRGPFKGYRGFVFGGPDEWSSPRYRLDSPGAIESLDNMVGVGANSAEIIVQWFVTDVNSTGMYAITDPASVQATTTDDELRSFAAAARDRGVSLSLSPMLDPDWSLPSQLGCRTSYPFPSGCGWRGQIGDKWGSVPGDCSVNTAWSAWWSEYSSMVLHYAALAGELKLEAFIIAHELSTPTQNCATQWTALIAAVREVFAGKVLVVSDTLTPNTPSLQWMRSLDLIGWECYQGQTAPVPASRLPWDDAALADMQLGVAASLQSLANFSALLGGLPIACTEGGWVAAPWASETGWGELTDLANGDVVPLNTQTHAHALAYEAFITVAEAQPWYAGAWFWLWRADPTAGGPSDASPTPWGKESGGRIAQLWA